MCNITEGPAGITISESDLEMPSTRPRTKRLLATFVKPLLVNPLTGVAIAYLSTSAVDVLGDCNWTTAGLRGINPVIIQSPVVLREARDRTVSEFPFQIFPEPSAWQEGISCQNF